MRPLRNPLRLVSPLEEFPPLGFLVGAQGPEGHQIKGDGRELRVRDTGSLLRLVATEPRRPVGGRLELRYQGLAGARGQADEDILARREGHQRFDLALIEKPRRKALPCRRHATDAPICCGRQAQGARGTG